MLRHFLRNFVARFRHLRQRASFVRSVLDDCKRGSVFVLVVVRARFYYKI